MISQDSFYSKRESDAFFERWQKKNNNFKLIRNHSYRVVKFITTNIDCNNMNILEIGCFIGDKLNYFKNKLNCNVKGIEPSKKACDFAKKKFNIKIENNTLVKSNFYNLKYNKKKFDLIILEDVLNWMDRKYFIQTLAIIDHLIKDYGYIYIKDYSPNFSYSNHNHHYPEKYEIKSYKFGGGYSSLFTRIGTYKIITSLIQQDKKYSLKDSSKTDHDISEDSLLQKLPINLFPTIKF